MTSPGEAIAPQKEPALGVRVQDALMARLISNQDKIKTKSRHNQDKFALFWRDHVADRIRLVEERREHGDPMPSRDQPLRVLSKV